MRFAITEETVFKVLSVGGRSVFGGTALWPPPYGGEPGRWLEVKGELAVCRNGFHLAVGPQIVRWLGPTLWIAEYGGDYLDAGTKVVARRARLVRRVDTWTAEVARQWCLEIAELVLPVYESECPNDTRVRQSFDVAREGNRMPAGAYSTLAKEAADEAPTPASAAAALAIQEACLWPKAQFTGYSKSYARRVAKQVVRAMADFGLNEEQAHRLLFTWLCRYLNRG